MMGECPMVKVGTAALPSFPSPQTRPPDPGEVTQGEPDMRNAMAYAFVVIAVAPLIGIWRGHVWAKAQGLVLRDNATSTATGSQTA
jgi:hypothetical protein